MGRSKFAKVLTTSVGVSRAVSGSGFMAAPRPVAKRWLGASSDEALYLIRAVGGRDLALGVGVTTAGITGRSPVGWLLAAAAADLVDGVVGAVMLEGRRRTETMVVALGVSALSAVAAAVEVAQSD